MMRRWDVCTFVDDGAFDMCSALTEVAKKPAVKRVTPRVLRSQFDYSKVGFVC
jgi:hypothetical protein